MFMGMDAKNILLTILGMSLGLYFFVAIALQPLAQLSDVTNANVTVGGVTTTFGAVADPATLAMIGLVALIFPIVFLMLYVNKIRGN
jgi:hypothetical protein